MLRKLACEICKTLHGSDVKLEPLPESDNLPKASTEWHRVVWHGVVVFVWLDARGILRMAAYRDVPQSAGRLETIEPPEAEEETLP